MNLEITEKPFAPIKMELTIDSLDELKYLWCMFNLAANTVRGQNRDNIDKRKSDFSVDEIPSYYIWDKIDTLLNERL